jgi:hypothetical protein
LLKGLRQFTIIHHSILWPLVKNWLNYLENLMLGHGQAKRKATGLSLQVRPPRHPTHFGLFAQSLARLRKRVSLSMLIYQVSKHSVDLWD